MNRPDNITLYRFNALSDNDTDFAAWGRYLQSKWREDNNIPIGTYTKKNKEDNTISLVPLGNYIEKKNADIAFDNETGGNFLTHNIWKVVKGAVANKEKGAKIEVNRLYRNLLSSQPLAFNLFAEMSFDKDLASTFFSSLFPDRIKEVTEILFEHSPGRGDLDYTGDHSAFDVFVEYISPSGHNGFAGIEVKYAESLRDSPSTHKPRYELISNTSGLFKDGSIQYLKQKPIQQIWRDHLLALSILQHKDKQYQEGFFIYLYPKDNIQCEQGVNKYIQNFKSYDPSSHLHDESLTGFYPRYLKNFMIKLRQLRQDDWTNELLKRYFDNSDLVEEIW